MNAAIWHHLVPFNETPTLLQGGGWISGSFAFAFAFGLRSQRVDGRRIDAFVGDLCCSRVHGGAAPIVSYVSALLVCVRVLICAFVQVCACARPFQCALVRAFAFPGIGPSISVMESTSREW